MNWSVQVPKEATKKKVRGIFERPPKSGIWWISYQRHGVRKREKVGRKSDALDLYRVRKTEILSGKKLPQNIRHAEVTFGTLVDAIAEYSRIHHKDRKTVAQRLATIRSAFGHRVAADIEPVEIDEWLTANTRTNATANRYKATFSLVYREAIRANRVQSNPAHKVAHRRESRGRTRFLTAKEEAKLRDVILDRCPHHLPEFVISVKSGMRRSEQYRLQWKEVDFDRAQIALDKTKNDMYRDIPMGPALIEAFQQLHGGEEHDPQDQVFSVREPRGWFAPVLEVANLSVPYTWHANRHTFCTRLAEAGAHPKTIMLLAGHKTIAASARYTHMLDSSLAAFMNKLG